VLIVFFTQYTSWNGIWGLYEQHASALPVFRDYPKKTTRVLPVIVLERID